MNKVTLVCLAGDKLETLDSLRDLGLLHLDHVKEPQSVDLDDSRALIHRTKSAISILDGLKTDPSVAATPEPGMPADKIADAIHGLCDRRAALTESLQTLRADLEKVRPYGSYEPAAIARLARSGIIVKLYAAPAKEAVAPPDNVSLFAISRDKSTQYFALVSRADFELEGHEEAALPNESLSSMEHEIELVAADLQQIGIDLQSHVASRDVLTKSLDVLAEEVEYTEAKDGMGATDRLAYLQGYCPIDQVDPLREKAAAKGWALSVREPTEDEAPPTLVQYPRWVKPIKAVFDGLGILPGYREADISMVFLLFFSVFFAMLIGDAGYGILFLALTFYARRKMKSAPAYPFILFGVLSVCTFVWGVLTGNYFGIPPESLPAAMQSLTLPWLTDAETSRDHIIKLCFIIGAAHLTVAHVWNAIVAFPDRKWLAQIGWVGLVWCMFYSAGHYVLGYDWPSWLVWLFVSSLVLIGLFMTSRKDLKSEWIHHAMLPLSVISCFVDVISYIRLFAVGMASAKVAMSVNMIFGLGVSKIWTIPIIAIILLAGHLLNIGLCALGILVHGVRLNTLEFSLHRDMQWSGFAYKPFSKRTLEA